jgi:hypothetical protein
MHGPGGYAKRCAGGQAQAAEARPNSARPATYTRRRSKRSPMLAAVMIPAAKTSR